MSEPKISISETDRLKELNSYQIIGEDEKDEYDFITAMAAQICDTKISLISLVTEDKQWFLSRHGLTERETSRDFSFCAHAIDFPERPFIVEDARKDARFAENPLITEEPHVVFYAGIPLVNEQGFPLGALCVIDDSPKRLTEYQIGQLQRLANQTIVNLELRRKNLQLSEANRNLDNAVKLLEITQEANQIGAWKLDIDSGETTWSDMVYKIHEVPLNFDHNKAKGIDFYHPDYRTLITKSIDEAINKDQSFDVVCQFITAKGNLKWVRSTGKRIGSKLIGSFQDITELKQRDVKFEGIFNSTMSFIGFLNTEGVLLEVNDTILRISDVKRSDVVGKYIWDCFWWQAPGESRERLKKGFDKAVGGEEVSFETKIAISNGQTVTILFGMRPVVDSMGKVMYVIPEGRIIDELVHTRERFRAVLEGTNVGTWEWNVQTGETIFNERWADIVGYTLEELAPINIETWMKLAHPDDLDESSKRLNECFERKSEYYQMEARMRHKEGHWVWVYDRGKVFEWTDDGKPLMMYGTHQDITIRKNKELEINYQKDILNALYELSPIGISLNDYETGKFIDINQKLLEPTGYSKEAFLALSYWDVTPREYAPLEEIAIKQMEESGHYEKFEKEYVRRDGSRYPVALSGMVVKDIHGKKLIWSLVQDISEEKEAERKLSEAINRLQAILEASTQVSIIATDPTGTVTLFNSGAEKMLGYRAEEIVGKRTPSVLHLPDEMERQSTALSEKYGREIGGFEVFVYEASLGIANTKEWTYRRKDGSLFPVLLSVTPVRLNQHITGFLGVATDISALKKVENEIKSLLEITQGQNERLRNFADIVSHNLRSHSFGISGVLQIFMSEYPEFADNEFIANLHQSSDNLTQTVEDLSEVISANMSENISEEINLYEVVQKNTDSLAYQIRKSDVSVHNLLDKSLTIIGVPAYVTSIVLNFITNAIKYSDPEKESFLKIFAERTENYVVLHFEDNGQGINLEKHGDKLFGIYNTFHRHSDSRGVGLYITKNQIESMGGKVEVISKVKLGTTFKVYLKG